MSIEAHPGSPPAMLQGFPVAADDEVEREASWAETAITVVAATVTIAFVSFVAVLMALA